MATSPDVTLHTCRSWTDSTPGMASSCARTEPSEMWDGVDSRSTSTDSRTTPHAPRRISSAMITDAMGSATTQPVHRTITAAATVPTEPSRSLSTCRYAARTWRLDVPDEWSILAATMFTSSPATATTNINPLLTDSGDRMRITASHTIHAEMASSV